MDKYVVSKKILDKYADLLINFALNDGKGIKKEEVVLLVVPECAKPMLVSLQKAILKSGGHTIIQYLPEGVSKDYYSLANESQLKFFPEKYLKGLIDTVDQKVFIEATIDKHELEGINPKKIMIKQEAFKKYKEWSDNKENSGKLTWVIALYGTEEMAKEVGLSLKEYWDQIIKACYLDYKDPIKKWREIFVEIERLRSKLNKMPIKELNIKSKNTDLIVGIDKNRRWLGGSGRNIPSFEVFISPDWRKTNGHIFFNYPLYRYGNLVKDIYLEFKNGRVVKVKAKKGEQVMKELVAVKNSDKIGEFSLTDIRLSRINKFMGETLFDENFGGEHGNSHLALGSAYKDSYPGNPMKVSKKKWDEMGYNEASVHTDMISTENKVVTAILEDGKKVVIYKNGRFTI